MRKQWKLLAAAILLLGAGCSVFPGLRVLSGEDPNGTGGPASIQNADVSELVMADKTGATDASLMAAADRIEAAAPNVDIIEIRKDDANNKFVVNMLFLPPAGCRPQYPGGLISLYRRSSARWKSPGRVHGRKRQARTRLTSI